MSEAALQGNAKNTAGVIARPPMLFLAALASGFELDHLLRLPFPIGPTGTAHAVSAVIAAAMIVGGLAFAAAGIRNFKEAGTPVPTNQPSRTLVTSGVHARSRNPIYLGMFLTYLGLGLVVRSAWVLILALPLWTLIRYGVIAREEAYLKARFGDAYLAYKARVRRWL